MNSKIYLCANPAMGTSLNIQWDTVDDMDWNEFQYVLKRLAEIRDEESSRMKSAANSGRSR